MLSTLIFTVVILHLLTGFGYLIYKLLPTKKVVESDNDKKKFE